MSAVAKTRIPFEQVFVLGGTGQTGHRLLERLVALQDEQPLRIIATSRALKGAFPDGPLAHTITDDAALWHGKVRWQALNLENESIAEELENIEGRLNPRKSTCCIIAGAFTNVEGCEVDPAKSERVNEVNTQAVLTWAKEKFNAKLVFYSTDYVFDGEEGPYDETHPRHSICKYGQSKIVIEEWIEANAPESLIIRTTGVYDYLEGSKNFLMQMLELWEQGKQTKIPSDQFGNPVWTDELARATIELLAHDESGIFHVGGGEQLARVDYAQLIARTFGLDPKLITPVETEELAQKAARPKKAGLRCEKLEKTLGWKPSTPKAVLAKFKAALAAQRG